MLKSMFNAKNFTCRLSWSILLQFTVEICAAAKNCKKILTLFWGSMSFKVIDVDKSKNDVSVRFVKKEWRRRRRREGWG